ncbi:two-component response regulator (plasmid) [Scytonema sp. HK-05]|uniref:response regulator transcription factor n=1 Tax=Scytonema sp. HK-05 TaxID=1137095 RepID=UPI0009366855|nr:response regulator transcription factor [Scytonema sp. HK-05]OKH57072.1 DNA-binding response regulator [Scytonema sp. HK-05]BAY50269.1 two-component response regulator [Scytonema sp. HK-05]
MIRILLVEDQELIRRGLKTLLETKPDLEVVGEAENGQEAIEQLKALHAASSPPDVVLMDIQMPVMNGVTATQLIYQQFPRTKILVLTTFHDAHYIAEALRFGAKGYLLKNMPAEELAKAIHSICQGYTQFGPGIVEKVIAQMPVTAPRQQQEPPPKLLELTAREREVLRMIAAGASNREIAQALVLTEGTVRNYISHILNRLNVRNRTQAANLANGFLSWLANSELPSATN